MISIKPLYRFLIFNTQPSRTVISRTLYKSTEKFSDKYSSDSNHNTKMSEDTGDLQIPSYLKVQSSAREMYELRLKRKERRKTLASTSAKLSFLTDPTLPSGSCVHISMDEKAYLINCPPGYIRHISNRNLTTRKIEDVFLTLPDSNRAAGLYGLLLTNTSIGSTEFKLHTSENNLSVIAETHKFFKFFTGISRDTILNTDGPFEDESITIETIPLNTGRGDNTIQGLVAYLCQIASLPGYLNAKKCKEFGVPVGPLLNELKHGKDVTLQNGVIVKSRDVCGPRIPGSRFLIVDCPSEHYIKYLEDSKKLNEVIKQQGDSKLDFIVHLSHAKVTSLLRYENWASKISPNILQILTGHPKPKKVVHNDVYKFLYALNIIDEHLFPMLYVEESIKNKIDEEKSQPSSKSLENLKQTHINQLTSNKIFVDSDSSLILRPQKFLLEDQSNIWINEIYEDNLAKEEFQLYLEELRELQKTIPKPEDYEPEVVILGSGSAKPSKYRNVSSILVNFTHPQEGSVILDCGEDTYGQLVRKYGIEKSNQILKNLKFIFITHYHADHHLGLYEILEKRSLVTQEVVPVLVPPGTDSLVEHYDERISKMRNSYKLYLTTELTFGNSNAHKSPPRSPTKKTDWHFRPPNSLQQIAQQTGGLIDSFQLVRVDHCPNSRAIVIKFKIEHEKMKDFTLVYSGDCRPCDELVKAGQNCDLLIHDSTFDPEGLEEAVFKKHCTSIEAIEVGRKMNARYTLLTHFSQRFPRVPLFNDYFDDKVGYAFDFLTLKCPSGYPRLPILKKILVFMFGDTDRRNEQRIERIVKKKRRAEVEEPYDSGYQQVDSSSKRLA